MARQIAIRLGTEGKAQVVADLDAIGTTGDAAFNRVAKSAAKAGRDASTAIEFANKQASKLAALLPGLNPTKLDMAAGVRDSVGKSAETSAAVFQAAYAKMETRAAALRSAIDPAYGAQQRFNREMGEARSLISAGAISLDEYVAKLRQEQAAMDAVASSGRRTGSAFAAAAPQIQDLFTQISMGGNPVNALVVQGGQLAGQLQYAGGKAQAFANVMMGPVGIGFQVALLLLSPLLGKLLKFTDAIEDGVDKLKKDATETENNRLAKERFARSAEGVTASIREQAEALDTAAKSERSAAERANILAKENLKREMSIRAVTAALLDQAIAQENIDKTRAQAPGQRGELGTLALTESSGRVAGLQTQLQANQKAIDQAKRNLMGTRIDLATESAARSADPMARIKKQYDDQATAARTAARARIKAGQDVDGALTRELATIERNRAAAVKAEQDKQKAAGETSRQYGREVTSREASAIARAAGLQVNSADRSTARQQQLYDAWIAQGKPKENPVAKPGTSAHERGNALDIQFQAGVTAKKIKDAFAAEGVRLTKVFAETGHWHVEWARTAAQRTASADAAKDTRDLARANKELDDDLDEVVKQFDPARQAADEYATSLAKIAALQAKGKLTVGEASGYKMELFHQEQKRLADAQLAQFKVLFGTDDPLAETMGQIQITRDAEVQSRADDYDKRKDGIRDLARYYRDAMTGGTKSIMDMFRQRGLDAISEMLAKWTLSKIGSSGGGGLLGAFTKLIGGASALAGGSSAFAGADLNVGAVSAGGGPYLPKLAAGTEYWSGGTALLGEHGPERAWLPAGTRVTPAGATRRLGDGGNAQPVTNHFDLRGAVMTADLLSQMNAMSQSMGIAAANGGSIMAAADAEASATRRLGRFR
jgi:LAS superfamily LD-carboxypeptidase LdcB